MHDLVPIARPAEPVETNVLPDLPPLAWPVALGPSGATLLCGTDVETFADG